MMLGLERRFAGDLVVEGGWRAEKEPEGLLVGAAL